MGLAFYVSGDVVEAAMVNGKVHGAKRAKGKVGAFFDDEIPGGKRHEDKKWAGVFAFFFLGEVGGSDMIQTQTTELDT